MVWNFTKPKSWCLGRILLEKFTKEKYVIMDFRENTIHKNCSWKVWQNGQNRKDKSDLIVANLYDLNMYIQGNGYYSNRKKFELTNEISYAIFNLRVGCCAYEGNK